MYTYVLLFTLMIFNQPLTTWAVKIVYIFFSYSSHLCIQVFLLLLNKQILKLRWVTMAVLSILCTHNDVDCMVNDSLPSFIMEFCAVFFLYRFGVHTAFSTPYQLEIIDEKKTTKPSVPYVCALKIQYKPQ